MMKARHVLVLGALLIAIAGCQRVTHDCLACYSDEPAHCGEPHPSYETKTSDEKIARCAAIERLCNSDRNGTTAHREACGRGRIGYEECKRVLASTAFSLRCEHESRTVLPFGGVR